MAQTSVLRSQVKPLGLESPWGGFVKSSVIAGMLLLSPAVTLLAVTLLGKVGPPAAFSSGVTYLYGLLAEGGQ